MTPDLRLRLRALLRPRRTERDLHDELAFHIERETQKLVAGGLSPAAARARARARFGSVALAADECRDARGTSVLDALVRDVLYAFRTFRRAPLAALTIVLTVGLGLGIVTVAFTIFNAFFFQPDAVRHPEELFAVVRPTQPGARAWIPFTRHDYEALRQETDVFTDAAAMLRLTTRADGRPAIGALVTGNFFQVLGVSAAHGRTLTPADDTQGGQPLAVLSHQGWTSLFGRDPSAVGRSLAINGVPCLIVGIMPADFRGLSQAVADYWAPLWLLDQLRPHSRPDLEPAVEVIGRLHSGLSPETAAARLAVWGAGRSDLKTSPGHPAYFTLKPKNGTLPFEPIGEVLAVFVPTCFAFGLILLIACANVANLLLARGLARAREIGTRLALGASRARVIRQLLTESLILAQLAGACGYAISRGVLDLALRLAIAGMPPEMAEHMNLTAPPTDWRVLLFLLCAGILSTAFFGLAPAFRATRLELVRTMRGDMARDARPERARAVLIGVQVTASALLLISAAVFLRSAAEASSSDPGVRTRDTLVLPITNEPLRAAILDAVGTHPVVAAVASSSPSLLGLSRSAYAEVRAATGASADSPIRNVVAYQFVSPEYFDVLDIEVVRGRRFTAAERSADAGVVIVSERVAREWWPDADPLGQVLRLHRERLPDDRRRPTEPTLPAGSYVVIGITRTTQSGVRMFDLLRPDVFVPIARDARGTSLTLRAHGDPELARGALLERLTRIDPALGEISTLRTMAGLGEYVLRLAFWGAVAVGALALLLTVSGLFSVLSYLVEQRRQDIGVRLALGATPSRVVRQVLSESLRPVALGLAAGAALAGALSTAIMATPLAAEIRGIVDVFDPLAYGGSLLMILIVCVVAASGPARRAARIDPMRTLRQE